ncbi:MAG: acetate--CoA ligase family protein [Patescibacteria group bacterium]|jgi:acetyltransferase
MSLNNFFNPRSVAVVGASNSPEKLGRQILDNIIKGGFKGRVYPINLKEKKIAKLKAYPNLAALPHAEMAGLLVVISIPAPFVVAEVKNCASLGIKNIIIITAGFKEAGEEGKKLEADIKEIASRHHLNILGPNCLGLINTWHKLNATFAAADTESGNCALLSQSGAIGAGALDWLKIKDFNFGYFISLGNKAVLDENEIIEYLAADKKIDLIIAYLEEMKDGGRFMEIISRLAKRKPVAILKAGTSAAGGKLAMSHTGSLAGSAAAVKAGVERAGAIWLDNLEDMFNLLMIFDKKSWFNTGSPELHVITNAGGVAVLTADEISRQGVPLGTSQDLLGDADAARYETALNKTLADKKINNLLVLLTPQTSTEPMKTAQAIIAVKKKYPNKLIMTSFVGGEAVAAPRKLLSENQIPSFDYPEEAVRSFRHLIAYRSLVKNLKPFKNTGITAKRTVKNGDYLQAFSLLKSYNIPAVKSLRYEEAKLQSYRYPAVLKTVGPDFLHKTDSGGVVVNLKDEAQLQAMAESLAKKNAWAFKNPENYLVVQEQANRFQEIILGFKRDAVFGPLLMVGWGGIYTEVMKDFKLAISDIDLAGAIKLIASLKIYPILNGARGQKKYDINALAQTIVKLAKLANEHPEISEFDINPLFVFEKGVSAGDVRIILSA